MSKRKPPLSLLKSGSLSGSHIRLRPLRKGDQKYSTAWRNDPEIRDSILGYRFPVTEEMEADWVNAALKDQSRGRVVFAIEDLADNMIVGFVYLNNIDWFSRNAELGILIGERNRQNRGFGREALALIVQYGFDTLNLNRIYLRVATFNKIALRLYRRFGFSEEGVLQQHAFVKGRFHNLVMFGLLRKTYNLKIKMK